MTAHIQVEVPVAGEARLSGTLMTPVHERPSPAVLLINGSGPLDRDSNLPGQSLNIANVIADSLAERGIATLRFDKRGVGASSGDYLSTGFHQETLDASAALAALCDRPEIQPSQVFVIGHSVGATIAIRLAAATESLAGAILLCAASRPGESVMRAQADRIAASMTGIQRLTAARFRRRQARDIRQLAETPGDVARIDGQELPARWFREYMSYDPEPDLAATRCPVLAITGRKDVQVDPADVERIRDLVAGPFTGLTPATLTHLLRTDSGPPGLAAYPAQLARPVDAQLLATISAWIADDQLSGWSPAEVGVGPQR